MVQTNTRRFLQYFSVSNRQKRRKEREKQRKRERLRSSEAYTNRRRRVILKRTAAVESRWETFKTFSFISMDMIRRAWIIRVHSEMTRMGLRSFLPERFLSEQGAGSFSRENGEESEGTGRNMLYYLSRKTPTHPTAPLRNKRDKGRNRNITEEERKGEREREKERLESIGETMEERTGKDG